MKAHGGWSGPDGEALPVPLRLPVLLLSQYLFFLTRRPVSSSNASYLESRLRGLRSLVPVLEGSGRPVLEAAARQLASLRGSALHRTGPGLQLTLLPVANAAQVLPTDVVVEDGGVPPDWLRDVRRALLVLGPGIGIGDELILAPLPGWLRAARPGLEVTTLSGYEGVWDGVQGVHRRLTYREHASLLAALQGRAPHEGYDLVVLADFEAPELYRCVATEGVLPRYLELSLGGRSAFFLDNRRRWLHRIHLHPHYHPNYYDTFHALLRALRVPSGGTRRFEGVFEMPDAEPDGATRIFVSPFTSKYEPSAVYWTGLLSGMLGERPGRETRIVLDRGKNRETARFGHGLVRSVEPRLPPGASISVAPSDGGGSLSLKGVFRTVGRSDLVVCTDSFVAHASALLGCRAAVLAGPGLRDWRVPHPGIFYFEADDSSDATARAIRRLLGYLLDDGDPHLRRGRFSRAEEELVERTAAVRSLLEDDAPPALVGEAYGGFCAALEVAAAAVGRWESELPWLVRDPGLLPPPRRIPRGDWGDPSRAAPLTEHARHELERWSHTNYARLLETALGPAPAGVPAGSAR